MAIPPIQSELPISDTAAGYELYTPAQIGVGALLGWPVARAFFLARNMRRLGEPRQANQWIVGSIIGTVTLLVALMLLPLGGIGGGLSAGYIAAFVILARQLQADALQRYQAAGGRIGSWWAVVGLGFLLLALTLVVFFDIALLLPTPKGT